MVRLKLCSISYPNHSASETLQTQSFEFLNDLRIVNALFGLQVPPKSEQKSYYIITIEVLFCFNCHWQIPITLHKTVELDKFGSPVLDTSGRQVMKCGFRIGGGIDQDPSRSPQGYPDKVRQGC